MVIKISYAWGDLYNGQQDMFSPIVAITKNNVPKGSPNPKSNLFLNLFAVYNAM